MNAPHRPAPTQDIPVVIIGAGPVGSVLALELACHGTRCVVVERSTEPSRHPKMDYVNGRSMELLRRLDIADELRERGVGAQHTSDFLWSRDFTEPPVAVWHYPSPAQLADRAAGTNDGTAPVEPYLRVRGSLLEEVLRARARQHPLIELREGWTCVSVEPESDGVLTTVSRGGTRHRIRSEYVVGCDGANSTIRQFAGIPVDVTAPPTRHCDVYFRSADPTLRRHGRAFLTIAAGGLMLVSRDEENTWTGTFEVLADKDLGDPVATMHQRLGVSFHIDEVINVARWEGALSVARTYRNGRVFLAGDAAHQFYPAGGHGANTGIGDAVDLGWKLAASLNGWGGPALLDSYELERRPVALFNREMCANLLEVMRRYHHMVTHGFSSAHIAGFLAQETYQIDNVGIHFGYRYSDSPIICQEPGPEPAWQWREITPVTWPGGRAPAVRLSDGEHLFDAFGTEFTLVDFSGHGQGEPLVRKAEGAGVPVNHLVVSDRHARAVWQRDLVLVRPDQHVAWHGDTAPDDWVEVLRRVSGNG